MSESLNPDLDDQTCAVTNCLLVADVIGAATVGLNPLVGAVKETLVLDLPLCVDHAHLLRMGVTTCELDSRLT